MNDVGTEMKAPLCDAYVKSKQNIYYPNQDGLNHVKMQTFAIHKMVGFI